MKIWTNERSKSFKETRANSLPFINCNLFQFPTTFFQHSEEIEAVGYKSGKGCINFMRYKDVKRYRDIKIWSHGPKNKAKVT